MTDEEKQAFLDSIKNATTSPASNALGNMNWDGVRKVMDNSSEAPPAPTSPDQQLQPDLQNIAQIESSGGKNKNHATTTVGLNAGDTAGGSTGLMPIMVKEILQKNPDLAEQYPDLADAPNDKVTEAINANPNMEAQVATAHWNRLNQIFDGDKARMAYAWRNGITAAKRASDIQVQEHPYVQKFLNGTPSQVARFDRLKGVLGN